MYTSPCRPTMSLFAIISEQTWKFSFNNSPNNNFGENLQQVHFTCANLSKQKLRITKASRVVSTSLDFFCLLSSPLHSALNKFSRSTRLQIAFPAQHYNLMAFSWLRKRFFNWGSLQLNYKFVHPRLPRCNLVGQRMKEVISHGDFIHALPTASDANLNVACALQKHLLDETVFFAHCFFKYRRPQLVGEDRKYWIHKGKVGSRCNGGN